MRTITDAVVQLLKVKSLVTILTTLTFVYLAITNGITQEFMVVYTVIIAFYFGTQTTKKEDKEE